MVGAPSINGIFEGMMPFNIQINFDIPLFHSKMDAKALNKWLRLPKGYYSIQKFSNNEKISFMLLKCLPHAKVWWEIYCVQHAENESKAIGIEPTWVAFVDVLKE